METDIAEVLRRLCDCPICCDQLEEARECPWCHCLFCDNCVGPWLQVHSSCPSCRQKTTREQCKENIPVQRFVNCLPVPCPFQVNGCRSMPAKADLTHHQNACEFHPEKIKQQNEIRRKTLQASSSKIVKAAKTFLTQKKKHQASQYIEHIDSLIEVAKKYFAMAEYLEAIKIASVALELAHCKEIIERKVYCLIKIGFWSTCQALYDKATESLVSARNLIDSSPDDKFSSATRKTELSAACSKLMGELYLKKGNFSEAEEMLQRAKELYLANPPSGVTMAELLNSLGLLAKKQSKFSVASTSYKQALKFLSQKDELWATVATNFADNARKIGELDEAMEQYHKIIICLRERYGSDKVPACAQIYNSLGVIYKKKGEYSKALDYYRDSTKIIKQFFGSKPHELVAINQANIGDVHRKLGNYEKAETSYYTALNALTSLYGPDHVEVAEVLHSQGLVCKKQGTYDKAEEYYTRALAIIEKEFGTSHYKYGLFSNSLGDIERKRGKYSNALVLYNRSLKVLQETLGASHIEVADVLFNLGLVDFQMEKYEDANRKYARAREMIVREFGTGHYKEGLVLNNAALAYAMLQQFDAAYKNLSEARRILEKQLGKDHIEVADCLTSLGDICMKLFVEDSTSGSSRIDEAKKYYTEANRIVLLVFGSTHKKAEQLASLLFICDNYSSL